MAHETFELPHHPMTLHQLRTCVPGNDAGDEGHVLHREFTGLALYACNCGYSSGWVDANALPQPSDWVLGHLPRGTEPWALRGSPDV
jgi:hypothetical protein